MVGGLTSVLLALKVEEEDKPRNAVACRSWKQVQTDSVPKPPKGRLLLA